MIIGITGKKEAGKDTAAEVLTKANFHNLKFADGLKCMLSAFLLYYGHDKETVERFIEGDLKKSSTDCFGGKTTRVAMQTLGTEWGREMIHKDIWIKATMNMCGRIQEAKKDVVLTDVRMPNEAQAVKDAGGTLIRITRPNLLSDDTHESEKYIDTFDVDYEITNDGTIPELQKEVLDILHLLDEDFDEDPGPVNLDIYAEQRHFGDE